ncbi:MAG TPA: 1-acyl-sn-glycerol-3-phosphate acyltransferase [Salinivirgaceae bacterium]|nr:1-acyl-sn-glycerol-3-phosphate acyltransferase [Salinivirgaceae bacterium]HQA75516.1 1-acyl-sn-glycerol-3-phosphate acyltransferase [Salinivirgaceae bacterium]
MLQIDLDAIFKEKNPKLAKRIPKFVMNIIKKILHVKDINNHLRNNGDRKGIDSVQFLIDSLNVTYEVFGIENLKKNHRYQFASNHPLGALDGITLLDVVNEHIGEPRFLVNDLLLKLEIFDPLFIPINSYGTTSKEIAKIIDQTYASNLQVIAFPSGMASRKIKGKIMDLEWKKSFVQKSIEHERDIVPVFFKGHNSNRFYRIANWRKRLGIKANIEMFFLPDEMFRQNNSHFKIFFGEPISWEELKNSGNVRQWTEDIRKIVYSLEK